MPQWHHPYAYPDTYTHSDAYTHPDLGRLERDIWGLWWLRFERAGRPVRLGGWTSLDAAIARAGDERARHEGMGDA